MPHVCTLVSIWIEKEVWCSLVFLVAVNSQSNVFFNWKEKERGCSFFLIFFIVVKMFCIHKAIRNGQIVNYRDVTLKCPVIVGLDFLLMIKTLISGLSTVNFLKLGQNDLEKSGHSKNLWSVNKTESTHRCS